VLETIKSDATCAYDQLRQAMINERPTANPPDGLARKLRGELPSNI